MFITAYAKERRSIKCTPSGTELEKTYGYEVDKKGMKNLVENGQKNVYEKIQEYAEETKIENVIQRVVAGDTSVLRPDAIYADITNYPKNMIEAMNQIKGLENTYANLPDELKEKYPDIETFVSEAGKEDWMVDMGYIDKTPVEPMETVIEKREESIPNEP